MSISDINVNELEILPMLTFSIFLVLPDLFVDFFFSYYVKRRLFYFPFF